MKRALASASAAVILIAGGCGDSDEGDAPAVGSTPSADALSGKDLICKNEIVRQMEDPSQETQDVPPQCEDITEDRLFELIEIAGAEAG